MATSPCTQTAPHSVQSGTDAEVVYTVNGHCDCPDVARAPEGRCKHRWAKCLVKRATAEVNAQQPQVPTYYASYYTADGVCFQGTARPRVGLGWIFHSAEEDFTLHCADAQNLVLGGRVDILEAQRAADGDLVRKVCTHNGARRRLSTPGASRPPPRRRRWTTTRLMPWSFSSHAPPLPDGCTCTRTTTETLGLLQYVWDEACPVHRLE